MRYSLALLLMLACQGGPLWNTDPGAAPEQAIDTRLYAAAGATIITPDPTRHPCPVYLGGTHQNRPAKGVHDDLEMRALLLRQGQEELLILALDVVGLLKPDVDAIKEEVARRGLRKDRVMVAALHTHAGPDTIGIWGPDVGHTGRCQAYIAFLCSAAGDLAESLVPRLAPVTVVAGEGEIHEEGSDHPSLILDFREPQVVQNRLTVLAFRDDNGATVATLVNWHAHPEVMIGSDLVSADFPHYLRRAVDAKVGGQCIYLSGTLGGLQTVLDLKVPLYTEDGQPDASGAFISDDNEVKQWSVGYTLARHVSLVLSKARPIEPALSIETTTVDLPFDNLLLAAAINSGLTASSSETMTGDCGEYGCLRQPISMASIGPVHLLCLPGEFFPESSVGRPAQTSDFGGQWGKKEFVAMDGWRVSLPPGHLLVEIGLCDNEIGYVVPAEDFLPPGHPDYYCEQDCLSPAVEGIVSSAVRDLLGRTH